MSGPAPCKPARDQPAAVVDRKVCAVAEHRECERRKSHPRPDAAIRPADRGSQTNVRRMVDPPNDWAEIRAVADEHKWQLVGPSGESDFFHRGMFDVLIHYDEHGNMKSGNHFRARTQVGSTFKKEVVISWLTSA